MSYSSPSVKEWHPERFTLGETPGINPTNPFIVIISNQPLKNRQLLLELCKKALLVICADGGANRLKDLKFTESEEQYCGLNAICGDLDSVHHEVLNYYAERHVKIFKDTDQYATDLTKCLRYIEQGDALDFARNILPKNQQIDVAIFGGLGGRADQAFSQLHHLHTMADRENLMWKRDIFLVTPESLIFLLESGLNSIHVPTLTAKFTENVGIIPIGRPSLITTHGLEWDVTDWYTEFGGQISTSNHVREGIDVIEIATTERVLFTLEFAAPESTEPSASEPKSLDDESKTS